MKIPIFKILKKSIIVLVLVKKLVAAVTHLIKGGP